LTLAAAVICQHNFCVMARTLLMVENSFCIMCNFKELRVAKIAHISTSALSAGGGNEGSGIKKGDTPYFFGRLLSADFRRPHHGRTTQDSKNVTSPHSITPWGGTTNSRPPHACP
jgi:hypothetical protein